MPMVLSCERLARISTQDIVQSLQYVWAPNSLCQRNGEDVEVVIHQMLQRGDSPPQVLFHMEELKKEK